jgi:thymidylate kinase
MNKQTVIIFEGMDRSGKSTISTELSKQLNIPKFKVQRNKYFWDVFCNINYLDEGVMQCIEQTGASIIFDRWVPSDFVYSKLFDRDISYRKIWEIDERLSKLNATLIVCYKTPEHFIEDIEDADFVNPTMYARMTELYREYASQSKIKNIMFIDTSDENLEKQIETIKKLLTGYEHVQLDII